MPTEPKVSIKPAPTFLVKEVVWVSPDEAYGDEVGPGCSYFTRVTIMKSSATDPKDLEQLQEQLNTTLSKEQV